MTTTTSPTERVGRYQLLEPIGIGPSGTVSRAKVFGVAGFERQFAVKRFHAELTATAAMAAMLSAAARAYGSLEHPRIARMSEFGVAQGATFTAVEYVPGLDALRLVGEARLAGATLAAGGALALVSQAARAVGYAHGRGLTHLGLAPTNVIVTADGDIKITDFGVLSATLPPRPLEVPRLAQRVPYLAPEQLANEATSAATDVFALGVLAYELVTGTRAFRGDSPQQVAAAVMAGPPAEPPLPRPIVRVLQRCLARSPFERFPDARALADALDAALRVAPVPGTRKDIGAQVKETLDRLAALNDGQMSGMVALHLGTGPIRRPDEARAMGSGREPGEIVSAAYERAPSAGGAATLTELPRAADTVPGVPPAPVAVPPGLGPSSPAPAAGPSVTPTLPGLGRAPAGGPLIRPRAAALSGPPTEPLHPATRAATDIDPPAGYVAEPSFLGDSAIHLLDPSDLLSVDSGPVENPVSAGPPPVPGDTRLATAADLLDTPARGLAAPTATGATAPPRAARGTAGNGSIPPNAAPGNGPVPPNAAPGNGRSPARASAAATATIAPATDPDAGSTPASATGAAPAGAAPPSPPIGPASPPRSSTPVADPAFASAGAAPPSPPIGPASPPRSSTPVADPAFAPAGAAPPSPPIGPASPPRSSTPVADPAFAPAGAAFVAGAPPTTAHSAGARPASPTSPAAATVSAASPSQTPRMAAATAAALETHATAAAHPLPAAAGTPAPGTAAATAGAPGLRTPPSASTAPPAGAPAQAARTAATATGPEARATSATYPPSPSASPFLGDPADPRAAAVAAQPTAPSDARATSTTYPPSTSASPPPATAAAAQAPRAAAVTAQPTAPSDARATSATYPPSTSASPPPATAAESSRAAAATAPPAAPSDARATSATYPPSTSASPSPATAAAAQPPRAAAVTDPLAAPSDARATSATYPPSTSASATAAQAPRAAAVTDPPAAPSEARTAAATYPPLTSASPSPATTAHAPRAAAATAQPTAPSDARATSTTHSPSTSASDTAAQPPRAAAVTAPPAASSKARTAAAQPPLSAAAFAAAAVPETHAAAPSGARAAMPPGPPSVVAAGTAPASRTGSPTDLTAASEAPRGVPGPAAPPKSVTAGWTTPSSDLDDADPGVPAAPPRAMAPHVSGIADALPSAVDALFDPVQRGEELATAAATATDGPLDRWTVRDLEPSVNRADTDTGMATSSPSPSRTEPTSARITIDEPGRLPPREPLSGALGPSGPPAPPLATPARPFPPASSVAAAGSPAGSGAAPATAQIVRDPASATAEISSEFAWSEGPETETDAAAGPASTADAPDAALPTGWIAAPPAPAPATVPVAEHRRRSRWIAVGTLGVAALGVVAWQLYSRVLVPPDSTRVVSARDARHVQLPTASPSPMDSARAASPTEAGRPTAATATTGRNDQPAAAPRAPADPHDQPAVAAAAGLAGNDPRSGSATGRHDPAAATAAPRATAPGAGQTPAAGTAAAAPRTTSPGTTTTPPAASTESLTIASTPSGARVFLDGADAGVTPLKLPGTPDRHNVALVLAGHELYVAQVDGHGTFQVPLKEVTPTNGPAGIKVLRCKDKERHYVFVDGKPTGQTCPTERIGCDVGPHTVEVYDAVSETRRRWDVVVKDTRLSYRIRIDP